VFLLGPAHKKSVDGCALTTCSIFKTPLGDLQVDRTITDELKSKSDLFSFYSVAEDENEHSLEMHLPYIRHIFKDKDISFIPVVVGSVPLDTHQELAKIFREYLKDERTLFCISSDFCHWGMRFMFIPVDDDSKTISENIEIMDKEGMNLIEKQDGSEFYDYLQRTKNTICGRNPITLFLESLKDSGISTETKFVKYGQSGKVEGKHDSSVSYAASYTIIV
jgi:AmmeMemoRadiSam system protein B